MHWPPQRLYVFRRGLHALIGVNKPFQNTRYEWLWQMNLWPLLYGAARLPESVHRIGNDLVSSQAETSLTDRLSEAIK